MIKSYYFLFVTQTVTCVLLSGKARHSLHSARPTSCAYLSPR